LAYVYIFVSHYILRVLEYLISETLLDLELRMWKKVIKSVLGEVPYKTLENIVNRELAKEAKIHA